MEKIESELLNNSIENNETIYPCLKCPKDGSFYVVLFSSKTTGIVVYSDAISFNVGDLIATDFDWYRDFTGEILLRGV